MKEKRGVNKKGQLTIIILLTLLIATGIILYYTLRNNEITTTIPPLFEEVYNEHQNCIKEIVNEGANIAGRKGGYIENPAFEPGSLYAPLSSQLPFLGEGIPYWIYLSGNNIIKEQTPTTNNIEEQLETYLEEQLERCNYEEYEEAGYDIFTGTPTADITLQEGNIRIHLEQELIMHKEEANTKITTHQLDITNNLYNNYQTAIELYTTLQQELNLEAYTIDVLRLNAPVTGTEITCSPKYFDKENIAKTIQQELEYNIQSIKIEGNYYDLQNKEQEYFIIPTEQEHNKEIQFLYDKNWPTHINIEGEEIAKPVGIQQGLNTLGFCYVPYHFVYDIHAPVLIQLYNEEELFQFPVTIIIENNQPRPEIYSLTSSEEETLCTYANQELEINTYDLNLNPVEANLQYRCLNRACSLGTTTNNNGIANLQTKAPQCINGTIEAQAEGYATTTLTMSTNEEHYKDIILNKEYTLPLNLGREVNKAMIAFEGTNYYTTALYPEQQDITLIEGNYNITLYIYEESNLQFPAIQRRECIDTAQEGIGGFLGLQEEKCFDINIPATTATTAIIGGGTTKEYLTEEQLATSNELQITAPLYGTPKNLEELQQNYEKIEREVIYLDYA